MDIKTYKAQDLQGTHIVRKAKSHIHITIEQWRKCWATREIQVKINSWYAFEIQV